LGVQPPLLDRFRSSNVPARALSSAALTPAKIARLKWSLRGRQLLSPSHLACRR
jgi:hypothetical protein